MIRGRIALENIGVKSALWIIPYFAGLGLISYYGAFGGTNLIPFGWDFLVIGIFSVAILFLAVKNRAAYAGEKVFDERFAAITTV